MTLHGEENPESPEPTTFQPWQSALEVNERRQLLYDSLVKLHGSDWDNTQGRQELADVAERIVAKSWCERLSLQELRELCGIERWDWYRWADLEEAEAGLVDLRTLVTFQMESTMDWLFEEGWKTVTSFDGMQDFADDVESIRSLGEKYGIERRQYGAVWKRLTVALQRSDRSKIYTARS